MTTPLPYLGIVLAAHAANVRLTLGAMGLGFGGFSRPLVAVDDDTATPESTPLAFAQMDASADSDLVSTLQALCYGDLPQIEGQWGEDGVIAAAAAQTAFGGNNVTIVSAAGLADEDRADWIAGNLANLGYKFRPEPEV